MPELPEVETIRRHLSSALIGGKVDSCHLKKSRLLFLKGDLVAFEGQLVDQRLIKIERKGKYLFFIFTSYMVTLHLGMSGRCILTDGSSLQPQSLVNHSLKNPEVINPISGKDIFEEVSSRHVYWSMMLRVGSRKINFRYLDPRTFGKIIAECHNDYSATKEFQKLGLDGYLSSERELAKAYPMILMTKNSRHQKSRQNIKSYLLSQDKIAGLGNIYVDECLFLARLLPTTRVDSITALQWKKLVKSFKKILAEAIENQGTSFGNLSESNQADYRMPDKSHGNHQQVLKVYGRKEEPCVECGEPLCQIKLNQRTTVFCQYCQH